MAEKLNLGAGLLIRQALAKTSGLCRVGTVWRTECFGSVVKKPLEETTSGYSDRRSRNSSGVERRAVDELDKMAGIDSRVEE